MWTWLCLPHTACLPALKAMVPMPGCVPRASLPCRNQQDQRPYKVASGQKWSYGEEMNHLHSDQGPPCSDIWSETNSSFAKSSFDCVWMVNTRAQK